MSQNVIVIKKIEVCGFGPFGQSQTFEFGPHVNVISGPNGSGKSWLLKALSFMFGPRYVDNGPAIRCLYNEFANENRPFVKLTINTSHSVCLDGTNRKKFTVKRFLTPDDIGNVYYGDRMTKPQSITTFHREFSFTVIEELLINNSSGPNEIDLMRMLRNAFELNKVKELAGSAIRSENRRKAELVNALMEYARNAHETETASLKEWRTLDLATIEKKITILEVRRREIFAKYPDKTEDDIISEVNIETKRKGNRLQAMQMSKNHNDTCAAFETKRFVLLAGIDKALNISADQLKAETDANALWANVLNLCVDALNKRAADCRTRQLFETKRKNSINLFETLSDACLGANILNNVTARNTAIAKIENDLTLFAEYTSLELRQFRRLQIEYDVCLAKLDQVNDQCQQDRRQFIEQLEQKYDALNEIVPMEIEGLNLAAEITERKMHIFEGFPAYYKFMNHQNIVGLKIAFDVLTDPKTDPKFGADFVGILMDFIPLDKIDDTFISWVVPVIMDILPMFIFERNSIGNEFKELVQKAAKDRKWWIFQFRPNDDARPIGDRKYKDFSTLAEILLTPDLRTQNHSVYFLFSQYLVFNGAGTPRSAQANAKEWKKTLIFPNEHFYYDPRGTRISIYNGTGDVFKHLLTMWHTVVLPERVKLFADSHEANKLYVAINQLETDVMIDDFDADMKKLNELTGKQRAHFRQSQRIFEDLEENTKRFIKSCDKQARLTCENDVRRLKLIVLQNGDLSDQAVKDAAKNLAEMIGTEAETLNVGYSKDVPLYPIELNVYALPAQKNIYAIHKAVSVGCQPNSMRVNGDDAESQLSDEILQLTKDMMELQQNGKLTNEFIKRLNELKHADHAEFIDANSLAKLRHLTIDELIDRSNRLKEQSPLICVPEKGNDYLKEPKKRTKSLTSICTKNQKSLAAYNLGPILSPAFERAAVRDKLRTLKSIINQMNEQPLSILENKSIAIRLRSSADQWILHRRVDLSAIDITFADLIDESMRMNFEYADPTTNEIIVTRLLDVNANAIAALFQLILGREVNANLLIVNWSFGCFEVEEMKYLIRKFGKRNHIAHRHRQLLFVPQPQSDHLNELFPNNAYKLINLP